MSVNPFVKKRRHSEFANNQKTTLIVKFGVSKQPDLPAYRAKRSMRTTGFADTSSLAHRFEDTNEVQTFENAFGAVKTEKKTSPIRVSGWRSIVLCKQRTNAFWEN